MKVAAQPLFYATTLARADLQLYVYGAVEPPAIDTIEFPDEEGGEQVREFALPYLAGMDEIALTAAELVFRVGDLTTDLADYSTRTGAGGKGVILTLPTAAQLRNVELQHSGAATLRTVVRPMHDNQPGPPILAAPALPSVGDMFGAPLTGLGITELGGSRHLLTLPDLSGTSWLFQLATGNEATELAPAAVEPTINRVAIAAAPRNLSITLQGATPTPLWGNPDVLLRGSGAQTVSFLPIAQRQLSSALHDAAPGTLTLPLTLSFRSESSARLEVTERRLAGEYRARPLGDAPFKLRLAACPAPLQLNAPAARRPSRAQATLTAHLLGRVLNGGSQPAPYVPPGRGLSATLERAVAACVPIVARPGDAAGAPVPLASFALRIDTPEAAEIVFELRADAAGRPGAIIAPTVVRQTKAGDAGWLEFELPAPQPVAPDTPIWAAIRMTMGSALWHAGDTPGANGLGNAFVSIDRGASWGDASGLLEATRPLLVQAFHVEDPPYRRPEILLHDGIGLVAGDWFAGADAEGGAQFRLADAVLPAALLARLADTPPRVGEARGDTQILLYSATVLELVLSGMVLSYDPVAT